MRSPLKVYSNCSSHTAHSLPTNVLSLRVRALSTSNTPAIAPRGVRASFLGSTSSLYCEFLEFRDVFEGVREGARRSEAAEVNHSPDGMDRRVREERGHQLLSETGV